MEVPDRPAPTQEGGRPAHEGSRGSAPREGRVPALGAGSDALGLAVTVLGAIAGIALIATLFMTVTSVEVPGGSCEVINDANPQLADRCTLTGLERHSVAYGLFGLLAIAMALGAGVGGSRPAALALIAIGAVAVLIALVSDFPESTRAGPIGRAFEGAEATKGAGLWLEVLAGLLSVAAGALRLAGPRTE